MKKYLVFLSITFFALGLAVNCAKDGAATEENKLLKDGTYSLATAPDSEMYFTKGVMKVENSKIVQFDWEIRDAARNDKLFDDKYGDDVFSGSEAYKKQCVENLAGMKAYAPRLIETQDISKVDAVTGATWAHSQFWLLVYKLTKKAQE